MTKRKCRRITHRQTLSQPPTAVRVGGRCLRALRDRAPPPSSVRASVLRCLRAAVARPLCVEGRCRRSVSTRPTCPARSTRTYGLPFRSILLYTQRYARLLFSILDFGATFILPTALPADGAVYARQNREYPRKPGCIYTVSILYRDFQGLSGIFRDLWESFQGNSASLRVPGAQSAAVKNCPLFSRFC